MYTRNKPPDERSKTLKEMYSRKGIVYWRDVPDKSLPLRHRRETLLRETMGEVLRERREEVGLRLRQMGTVSIGFASEVERGKKEASSEILQSMCQSLDISVAEILRRTADRMEAVSEKELVDA